MAMLARRTVLSGCVTRVTPLGVVGLRALSTKRSLSAAATPQLDVEMETVGMSIDDAPQKLPRTGIHHVEGFVNRHVGPTPEDVQEMLKVCGATDLDEYIATVVPDAIKLKNPLTIGDGMTEKEMLEHLRKIADQNTVLRSHIGMGYYDTVVPTVILRNVLESPAWYTPYTPYQPEISQGRLESLLNFQTGVMDLTGMEVANASLLDEGTAAAEAMSMSYSICRQKKKTFWVSDRAHPQTVAVMMTRAKGFGITLTKMSTDDMLTKLNAGEGKDLAGVLIQYPDTTGAVADLSDVAAAVKKAGGLTCVASDLLSLTLLKPPGEWGADVVLGSAQRFGVPMGYGGPHAAFYATHSKYRRNMPGRIIGVSRDAAGNPAMRLTLQTREQHIRRDKATSNVCTAQALLANMAAFFMLFHGPTGLVNIATRTHNVAKSFASAVKTIPGATLGSESFFDTVHIALDSEQTVDAVMAAAVDAGFNLRKLQGTTDQICVAFDETSTVAHAQEVVDVLSKVLGGSATVTSEVTGDNIPTGLQRTTPVLSHPIFNKFSSETDMLRYIYHLQNKDLGLQHAMMPLGSCTMKLNSTTEMIPVTWSEYGGIHPYAPKDQAKGYQYLFDDLEKDLANLTGFAKVSLQPNSGAQGEYAGLMAIASYHRATSTTNSTGSTKRDICLIPMSAHGTNPASAVMAGMRVVPVQCDDDGNVDVSDLYAKAEKHSAQLAALMITYPSTHGVFETTVKDICDKMHEHGGMVYMDGANLNAQCGLCSPGEIGADVCHLNLHKTFCIPHGGGGPGMGPIGVVEALAPHLPSDPLDTVYNPSSVGNTVCAAPYGSSSILPISYAYIKMMGSEGLTYATKIAILSANYLKELLKDDYKVLFTANNGTVAHEFILDLRPFKAAVGVSEADVAKRLIDYSFHAPTMSWPVAGTLMVEPTESEPKKELDRFADAMKAIRAEIQEVMDGKQAKASNCLTHAPHTIMDVSSPVWDRGYSRDKACYPVEGLRKDKFWATVGRVDDVYGDRNPVCSCPSMDEYS